jgi:hypothetical protein
MKKVKVSDEFLLEKLDEKICPLCKKKGTLTRLSGYKVICDINKDGCNTPFIFLKKEEY